MICFDAAYRLVDIVFPPTALTTGLRQLVALGHLHSVLRGDPVHVAACVGEHARISRPIDELTLN